MKSRNMSGATANSQVRDTTTDLLHLISLIYGPDDAFLSHNQSFLSTPFEEPFMKFFITVSTLLILASAQTAFAQDSTTPRASDKTSEKSRKIVGPFYQKCEA